MIIKKELNNKESDVKDFIFEKQNELRLSHKFEGATNSIGKS